MLWKAGFTVLEASGGDEALRIAQKQPSRIHLLLTDVLMPDMNGCELAVALRSARPDLRVLYMSGYTDAAIFERTGKSIGEAPLIRKPFTQYKLITKIQDVLEEHTIPAA